MRVRFATGNAGKAHEAREILSHFGLEVEAVEARAVEIQADTLAEVARAKAESLRGKIRPPYFVEDAGLFVDALRGFPGVYSAHAFRTIGVEGILRLLGKTRKRRAAFGAVVAFVGGAGPPRLLRGSCMGTIAESPRGRRGFGFDPIFIPESSSRTFAQLSGPEKSAASHRGVALRHLGRHLVKHHRQRNG